MFFAAAASLRKPKSSEAALVGAYMYEGHMGALWVHIGAYGCI